MIRRVGRVTPIAGQGDRPRGRRRAGLLGLMATVAFVLAGVWLMWVGSWVQAMNHEPGEPFDLVVLVDASESILGGDGDNRQMANGLVALTLESLRLILGNDSSSRVAIVPFSNTADGLALLLPPAQASIPAPGQSPLVPGTDFAMALDTAYSIFCPEESARDDVEPRRRLVVLITDGEPDVGTLETGQENVIENTAYLRNNVQSRIDHYTTGRRDCGVTGAEESDTGGGYELIVLSLPLHWDEYQDDPHPYEAFWEQPDTQDFYRYLPVEDIGDLYEVFNLLIDLLGLPPVTAYMGVDSDQDALHTFSSGEFFLFIPSEAPDDDTRALVAINADTGEEKPFLYGGQDPPFVLEQLLPGRWGFTLKDDVDGDLYVVSQLLPVATPEPSLYPTESPTASSTPAPTEMPTSTATATLTATATAETPSPLPGPVTPVPEPPPPPTPKPEPAPPARLIPTRVLWIVSLLLALLLLWFVWFLLKRYRPALERHAGHLVYALKQSDGSWAKWLGAYLTRHKRFERLEDQYLAHLLRNALESIDLAKASPNQRDQFNQVSQWMAQKPDERYKELAAIVHNPEQNDYVYLGTARFSILLKYGEYGDEHLTEACDFVREQLKKHEYDLARVTVGICLEILWQQKKLNQHLMLSREAELKNHTDIVNFSEGEANRLVARPRPN